AVEALAATGKTSDSELAEQMRPLSEGAPFADVCAVFCTQNGEPRKRLGTRAVDAATLDWLAAEQTRIVEARGRMRAATVARDTVHVLALAVAYAEIYEGTKRQRGALDFADLIARTHALLTKEAGAAAWVLYKLDGGIGHVLLDEAQDTAPDQW